MKKGSYFVSGYNRPDDILRANPEELKNLRTKGKFYKANSYRDAHLKYKNDSDNLGYTDSINVYMIDKIPKDKKKGKFLVKGSASEKDIYGG